MAAGDVPAVEVPVVELLPEFPLPVVVDELLVLVELCPELPLPVDPPPKAYIAIANSEGRVASCTRPGTSIGVVACEITNSFWPL